MGNVGVAFHALLASADALCGTVAARCGDRRAIELHELGKVHIGPECAFNSSLSALDELDETTTAQGRFQLGDIWHETPAEERELAYAQPAACGVPFMHPTAWWPQPWQSQTAAQASCFARAFCRPSCPAWQRR